ncbi:polysaccharide deacetylase family protein [Polaribacter sp.]|nr:polysaccharide deacetylase family protein [Polaribacter sp.]
MKKITIIGLLILGIIFITFSFSMCIKSADILPQNNKKYIYLTFDDGPLNGSQRINDAILSEKIPITVLLVGEHALVRPKDVDLYRENEYIEIGNHSYSHANDHYKLYYSNPEGVLKDFKRLKIL